MTDVSAKVSRSDTVCLDCKSLIAEDLQLLMHRDSVEQAYQNARQQAEAAIPPEV